MASPSWELTTELATGRPSWELAPEPEAVPAVRLRSDSGGGRTMYGRFSNPGEWAEINNVLEGHFLESIGPTAFATAIERKRDQIRVLFHHGHDVTIGMKPLGVIERLDPDTRYEVALFDVDYVNALLPALRANQLGVSFRFKVVKDEIRKYPARSAHNPKQLPEVTVVEGDLVEFGPTPTPAYKGPSAAVRSSNVLENLLGDLRSGSHLLGPYERWRTRPKPGCPGVVERERVATSQVASWEEGAEDAWWSLPRTSDWWLR